MEKCGTVSKKKSSKYTLIRCWTATDRISELATNIITAPWALRPHSDLKRHSIIAWCSWCILHAQTATNPAGCMLKCRLQLPSSRQTYDGCCAKEVILGVRKQAMFWIHFHVVKRLKCLHIVIQDDKIKSREECMQHRSKTSIRHKIRNNATYTIWLSFSFSLQFLARV